ncbi:MAG: urea transporter [Epsilonproteobacteria bacterium]|jgi:urea transporter|nr:urea transporter [Campylobacterota bacterium]NPA88794.1 peptidoglycan DD-metalloendopeptidase family protein [Campylobacterota bacterium]
MNFLSLFRGKEGSWKYLFRPYIHLFFLRDFRAGILLFVLSFLYPSVGIGGLVALISTFIFAKFIGMREEWLGEGFYLYNSLLVGMGVGFTYQTTPLTIGITILLAILTFLTTFGIRKIFFTYGLPILSVPFSVVSMIFGLASYRYLGLAENLKQGSIWEIPISPQSPFYPIWATYFAPFFKSLGTIIFLPSPTAGLVIGLIILLYSRILFMLALGGFWVGVLFHSLFVPFGLALTSAFNFNFILVAMAVGGIFLVPHWKNYLWAIVAVMIAVILSDGVGRFLTLFGLPVYTIPFNMVVILIALLFSAIGYHLYNWTPKETPEESLNYFLSNLYRFGGREIKIGLPFLGKWSVYQGFNGKWTHQGKWRYAYDFVIKKNGKTYRNDGTQLGDYYAFGEPVVAPISGQVVAVRGELPDNFIGEVDRVNNWGNFVIIYSPLGFWVEISHLMQNSILVKVGDYVEEGQIIAKCGNSGYSPEPHIHIQVQESGYLGSGTLPFTFKEYIKGEELIYYSLPEEGEEIEAPVLDRFAQLRFTFILDDVYRYRVVKGKNEGEIVEFKVKMNPRGEFYFEDGERNRLYFHQIGRLFYFYDYRGGEGYLKELFKLAPRVPLIHREVTFRDILPISIRYRGWQIGVMEFLLSFNPSLFKEEKRYKLTHWGLESEGGRVKFSMSHKGFDLIEGEEFQLERIFNDG